MDDADGYGRLTGTCGDTMQIFLKFEKGRVKAATYLSDGCGSSAVCGSLAAELSLDRTTDELMDFSGEKILDVLGAFHEEDQHCAFLAVETVQDAVQEYMKRTGQAERWKFKKRRRSGLRSLALPHQLKCLNLAQALPDVLSNRQIQNLKTLNDAVPTFPTASDSMWNDRH